MGSAQDLQKNYHTQNKLEIRGLIEKHRISSASSMIKEMFSINMQDYPQKYLQTERVSNFISWVEKNDGLLTKELNQTLENNKNIIDMLGFLKDGQDRFRYKMQIQEVLESLISYTRIKDPRGVENIEKYSELLHDKALVMMAGVFLGQRYISSTYKMTDEQDHPQFRFFADETRHYKKSNIIGISLTTIVDPNLRKNLDLESLFISSVDSGIHEGTHALPIVNRIDDAPLSELATYITSEKYALPIKSSKYLELWNIPILDREKKAQRFGSENKKLRKMNMLKSFYLAHFMGPWIHNWLKEKQGEDVDITKYSIDDSRTMPQISAYELYRAYERGELEDGSVQDFCYGFCKNTGIKEKWLIDKILEVFVEFRECMKNDMEPFDALLRSLEFNTEKQPEIPKDVLDGYAGLVKKRRPTEFLA